MNNSGRAVSAKEEQPIDFAIIPRILLDRLELDPERRIHVNVLLSTVALFIAAVLAGHFEDVLRAVPHVCLSQVLLGMPCPGCGVTRSALAFMAGHMDQAWTLNPAGPVLCAATVIQVPLRLVVLLGAYSSKAAMKTSRALTSLVVTVLMVNWLIQIL